MMPILFRIVHAFSIFLVGFGLKLGFEIKLEGCLLEKYFSVVHLSENCDTLVLDRKDLISVIVHCMTLIISVMSYDDDSSLQSFWKRGIDMYLYCNLDFSSHDSSSFIENHRGKKENFKYSFHR